MAPQQLPTRYQDLPIVHIYGSSRVKPPVILVLLFGLIVFLYSTHKLVGYEEQNPSDYIKWMYASEIFGIISNNMWQFLFVITPWLCAWSGFFAMLFGKNTTAKGLFYGTTGFVTLFIWNVIAYYHESWHVVTGDSLEYWAMQTLFLSIMIICIYKNKKMKKEVTASL